MDEARKLQKTIVDNLPPAVAETAQRTRSQTEDALGELQEHAKNMARTFLNKIDDKNR